MPQGNTSSFRPKSLFEPECEEANGAPKLDISTFLKASLLNWRRITLSSASPSSSLLTICLFETKVRESSAALCFLKGLLLGGRGDTLLFPGGERETVVDLLEALSSSISSNFGDHSLLLIWEDARCLRWVRKPLLVWIEAEADHITKLNMS